MSAPSELVRAREVLESLDDTILDALFRRAAMVRDIAELKAAHGLAFKDEERERLTVERWRRRATELGLEPDVAEHVARAVLGVRLS
ncbi:MAG: chorismate mutase [Alphaproteobacteria bacterium]|nr:chorismate mutase [Alphaproteobacteria bacterium]MCB9696470.1 chorismate mutase [Alphaproteobacteria bacterium]